MSTIMQFIQSEQFLGLLAAFSIFILTVWLVVKRFIGFPVALLLLIFALVAGLLINHQTAIRDYFSGRTPMQQPDHYHPEEAYPNDFQKQIQEAIHQLQQEVASEKENLNQLMNQVNDVFKVVETEKQKLDNFIETTREQLSQKNETFTERTQLDYESLDKQKGDQFNENPSFPIENQP